MEKTKEVSKNETAKPVQKPITPVRRNRNEKIFVHDLFISDVAKALKNGTYKKNQLLPVYVEHKHVFHSHTSKGKKLDKCGSSQGHFHYCTMKMGKDGKLLVESGPAMREYTETLDDGRSFVRVEEVSYKSISSKGSLENVQDKHTHEFLYEGSEDLSQSGLVEFKKQQREMAQEMGVGFSNDSIRNFDPAPIIPSVDGVEVK